MAKVNGEGRAVHVWCPECGAKGRVAFDVPLQRMPVQFACPECGRIASVAACTIGYADPVPEYASPAFMQSIADQVNGTTTPRKAGA